MKRGDTFRNSMTDLSINTQTAPPVRTIAGSVSSLVKSVPVQSSTIAPGDEVEDYTIKCICGFQDDDGNTVYCERCDTWQHTECYYIDREGNVPTNEDLVYIDHFCGDCKPRHLDTKGAIERQRNRRKELELGDRKVKKTTSKSHKKKVRGPESNVPLTNGLSHSEADPFPDRTSRSPRDQNPPAKRPKTNHRTSNSMHFAVLPQNLTSHPHKASGPMVPGPPKKHSKQSLDEPTRDPYSAEFLQLYDDDPGDGPMQTNLLNDISITRDLSDWSHDIELLREATNGLSPQDVFNRCDQPVASMSLPQLNKGYKQDESPARGGRRPRWTYLTIDSFRPKGSIVSELRGKIGHMQHYIQEPTNRWEYLRHPAPFVFFHPRLPIYIDTRSEGTTCRYLRRSCDPNLSMKTFLENGSDYHFCFVAKKDLEAGSELTIGWVLDEHIRSFFSNRSHEDVKLDGDVDAEEDYVTDWVGKVLAEFGGCACNSPSACAFARYDRRGSRDGKVKNGNSDKHSNNEYAANSRAGSEHDDGRSSSGSKSQSRDMTPIRNAPSDLGFGGGLEISDREKRKIAALEKNFEQLENDKHQPAHKKKKRNSGGSNVNTPVVGTSVGTHYYTSMRALAKTVEQKQLGHISMSFSQPNTPGIPSKPQYADASTSRRKSGSPTRKPSNMFARPRSATATQAKKRASQHNTPSVPSPLVRQNYVSSSMQTDPDWEDDWYHPPKNHIPAKKPYVSLTKRLLLRSQKDREKLEDRKRTPNSNTMTSAPNDSPVSGSSIPASSHTRDDVEMQDAGPWPPSTSAHAPADYLAHSPEVKPPPPWPSHGTQQATEVGRPMNGFRPNDLRVQLPSKPLQPPDSSSNTPLVETPTSAATQSPFIPNLATYPPLCSSSSSHLVQPSPIKKKVSLGEYFSRRKGSQPATEMAATSSLIMQQGSLKHSGSMNGESKDGGMQGSAIVDTPKKEESDPLGEGEEKDPKL